MNINYVCLQALVLVIVLEHKLQDLSSMNIHFVCLQTAVLVIVLVQKLHNLCPP